MEKCKTNVRSHEVKGVEIELIGDCGDLVDDIMKNLGPYGRRYWEKKMVFVNKEGETPNSSDSPSK